MRRLEAAGQLSIQEKEDEQMFLHPGKIEDMRLEKIRKEEEKRLEIIDQDNIEAKDKKRFDWRERTILTDIPPAKIRIEEKKRRDLSAKYEQKVEEAVAKKQRP